MPKFQTLFDDNKSNHHDVKTLEGIVAQHETSLEKTENDLNGSIKRMEESIKNLGLKIDDNDKKDLTQRSLAEGEALVWKKVSGVLIALGTLAGIYAIFYK